jgi:very-short-patch-repair endonuclease
MIDDHLHKGAKPALFEYARLNKQTQTPAETLLWQHLRNRRLKGHKFRRQHPISDFIADFYCAEQKLIIELDGGYHDEPDQQQYDEGRTCELKDIGIKVIRFTNQEVLNCIKDVLERIIAELAGPCRSENGS